MGPPAELILSANVCYYERCFWKILKKFHRCKVFEKSIFLKTSKCHYGMYFFIKSISYHIFYVVSYLTIVCRRSVHYYPTNEYHWMYQTYFVFGCDAFFFNLRIWKVLTEFHRCRLLTNWYTVWRVIAVKMKEGYYYFPNQVTRVLEKYRYAQNSKGFSFQYPTMYIGKNNILLVWA